MNGVIFTDILQRDPAWAEALAALKSGNSISVEGVLGGSCAPAAVSIGKTVRKTVLLVVPNEAILERTLGDFEIFSEHEVYFFPQQKLSQQAQSISDTAKDAESENATVFALADDQFGQRIRTLKHLADRLKPFENSGSCDGLVLNLEGDIPASIVVSSIAALLQPVPPPKMLAERTLRLAVGEKIELEKFRRFLVEGGYHSTPAVDLPGEFAVRGYILDIFAPDWNQPVRVELFDDEIESIRHFDVVTQRSLPNAQEPVSEISLTRLLPNESTGASLTDYLPKDAVVILLEPRLLEQEGRAFLDMACPKNPLVPPLEEDEDNYYRSISSVFRELLKHPTATFSNLAEGLEDVHVRLPVASVERLHGNLETVKRELDFCDTEQIFIFCPTEAESTRLAELLADLTPAKEGRLFFPVGQLSEGFKLRAGGELKVKPNDSQLSTPNSQFLLLAAGQLFDRHDLRRPKRRQLGQVIDSFLDLQPGDFVVHVSHGIARYRGIETLTKGQQEEEHLHLEFADSQVLYVPISKIGLVQKYVAGGRHKPKLAKIGGALWARHKKAVQEAVFDLAEEMIDLQARRGALPGTAFPPDSSWQSEFDAAFPFRETNDQLLAIEAVKRDMELARPMDRLLCGDVGFGKTEVAVRAAFKAVDAGYQVTVLVPTTILAEQHARTFSERMKDFPITVAALSRFQSPKEQKRIVEELALGKIDIVIGTHRIVSKDIRFHHLGLVVIDEEQRFGVAHKERLKTLRDSVDVLTMTATPIPRTLHFSLLGIREISNLETPPENRLAVETRLIRYSEDVIRSAVLRELDRGGQIYFVHNRVQDIDEFADRIQRIVPECRIGVGHAQMEDGELEKVMCAFVKHEFDMLISTTIIESGLDIPNANTMFIDEASRYGLADLHQLRGRVGRSTRQAYCFLVLPRNQMLTSQAAKRLRAIEEYAHLGSGFHLAMRDLEIRGAGNILGTQQSGHIATVGYEMYCQFLEAAVRALKRMPPKTTIDVELDLPGLALIPENYVTDQRIKIDLYRRLTRVATLEECADLEAEILDRFGPSPAPVQRLLVHSKIRVLAHEHRIRAIRLEDGLAGDSGYVVLEYVAPRLIRLLADYVKSLGMAMRLTDDHHAFVPMPKNLSRNADPDAVLELVVKILGG